MLESVDPWILKHEGIGKHEGNHAVPSPVYSTPHLPDGWILYSACYTIRGAKKGWNVELLNTAGPFRKTSIVAGWHREKLDAALLAASSKTGGGRLAARG